MPGPGPLHHVAIQVRDLGRVVAFYEGVLGLPVLRRWPWPDGTGERSVWLDVGGGAFLAIEALGAGGGPGGGAGGGAGHGDGAATDPWPSPRPGLHLVALTIAAEARAAWERRLADAGIAIAHRTDFTLYVRDPEGNRVGLSHYPHQLAQAGPGQPGNQG